jgi:RimJ/RimL family protein N-acetyltransferase
MIWQESSSPFHHLSIIMTKNISPLTAKDIQYIVNYFHECDDNVLLAMGVDRKKLPEPAKWCEIIAEDLAKNLTERLFYYLLWEIDGKPIGHSNINKIVYDDHAYVHMHVWHQGLRRNGHGLFFVQKCIAEYFEKFKLKKIYCEPNADNRPPNTLLAKSGFTFLKEYETVPGSINFQQKVKRWVLTESDLRDIQ